MEGVNKAIIMGTVGSDPEVKKVGERTLAKFSVATNRSFKSKKTGERETQTQWHNIEAWGPMADYIAENVKKGKHVYLEGEIRYNKYEKDGVTRYSTSIMALEFRFAGNSGTNGANGESKAAVPEAVAKESVKQYANASAPAASEPVHTASSADVMDNSDEDDLPF